MNTTKLLTQIGAALSGATLHRLASLIATLVAAQLLPTAEFGQLIAILALLQLTGICFDLGLELWLLRQPDPNSAFQTVLPLRLLGGLVWIVVVLILARVLDPTIYTMRLVAIGALFIWLEILLNTYFAWFKSQINNARIFETAIITATLTTITTVGLFALQQVTIELVIWTRILPLIAGLIFAISASPKQRLQFIWQDLFAVLKQTPPYAASVLLAAAYTYADITIIASTLGTTAVGHYGLATRILTALFIIPNAIHTVMVPVIANAEGNASHQRTNYKSQLMVGAALAASLLLLAVIGSTVGPEKYQPAANLLLWLSLIMVFRGVSFAAATNLVAHNWQSKRVWVQAIVAIFNIVLTYLAAQQGSLAGVALVYLASEICLAAGYFSLDKRLQRTLS